MANTEQDRLEPIANLLQILGVFFVASLIIGIGWSVVGEDPFARQAVVWVANVSMLFTIWLGLRARHESWSHLGLKGTPGGKREIVRLLGQSVAVLAFALAAFIVGSMLTMGLASSPESADMSSYGYLEGNLPMLVIALAAVFIVSSFGEELVYRGFLMTRIAEMGKGTKTAWAVAALLSSIVFGAAHFSWGVVGIVQTTFMGLALAVSFLLAKRNLWPLVLAHAYIDTILLVQMYLGPGPAEP